MKEKEDEKNKDEKSVKTSIRRTMKMLMEKRRRKKL
jgi:hypothetical protein